MTAQLALGTYRCQAIPEAAVRAAASGAWIDTAPNYATGQAQTLLSSVLAAHPHVRISTKAGFFTAATGADAVNDGALTEDQAVAGHSLAPDYVRWQIRRNRVQLGRERLDLVLLHNPSRPTPATVPPSTARSGTRSRSWKRKRRPGAWPGTGSPPGRAWKKRRSRWGSCWLWCKPLPFDKADLVRG